MDMISAADLLLGLQIVISVIVVVVLYHILFIVVDLRKVLRRVDDITEQVEAIILKPIALADQILAKVMELMEAGAEKHHKKKGKKGKHHKVIDG
jgi:cell shape-determining protein MreC